MTVSQISLTPDGPTLSRIVVGFMHLAGWQLSTQELIAMIEACLDMGITTFDHADIYGSYTCEALFGQALAQAPELRDKMQLITKCGIKLVSENRPEHKIHGYDTGKHHILASVENSLKQLQTDYVDLLLIHRPDPLMDADETGEALTELKKSGKTLHVGVSNFMPWQFELLASRLDFPLVTNQVELSVMNMAMLHNGVVDLCQRLRIVPMAWSPLGGGEIFTGQNDQAVRVRQALTEVGQQLGGASVDQVALAWLMKHPANIIPVLGTGKLERIKAAAAAEKLNLSRDQWFAIWQASAGHEVP